MVLLNADQSTPSSPAGTSTPTQPQSSFLEIPASMMEKMLVDKTNEVGAIINDSINGIRKNRDRFREDLKGSINLHYDDGDYSINKNTDLIKI